MQITNRESQRKSFHPLADIFPLMEGKEFGELCTDIIQHGLLEPIVVYEGKILDGRNRYRACQALRFKPSFTPYRGDDPAAYVISANIRRRHLTAAQRRDLIAELLKAKPEASNNAIAKQVKVDDKTVAKVRRGMEARSEIPNVTTRTDAKGRKQPACKAKRKKANKAVPDATVIAEFNATVDKIRAKQLDRKPEPEAIGPNSAGEIARKDARIGELEAEKRRLEIKIQGLEDEVEQLRAENAELRARVDDVLVGSDPGDCLRRRAP